MFPLICLTMSKLNTQACDEPGVAIAAVFRSRLLASDRMIAPELERAVNLMGFIAARISIGIVLRDAKEIALLYDTTCVGYPVPQWSAIRLSDCWSNDQMW